MACCGCGVRVTWSMVVFGLLVCGMSAAIVSLTLARVQCGKLKFRRILSYSGISAPVSAILNYVRQIDMKNLNSVVYMDFSKRGVILDSQINAAEAFLATNFMSNTHSSSKSGILTRKIVGQLRKDILKTVLSTTSKRYTLIFTGSVASSWKLLGESFPWTSASTFWYNESTSADVLGIRRIGGFYNASFKPFNASILSRVPTIPNDEVIATKLKQDPVNLMVLPLVSAFDGARTPNSVLRAVAKAASVELLVDKEPCFVAADATVALGSTNVNLTDTPFHAVVLSFEELFGMPELSALVVRKDALKHLKKRYYGGGSVAYSLVEQSQEEPLSGAAGWEDGTLMYQQIASLNPGLDLFEVFDKQAKEKRLFALSQRLYNNLKNLKAPITFYGNHELASSDYQAPIVTFRVDSIAPQTLVDLARENNFIIRSVCKESLKRCLEASNITENQFHQSFNASIPLESQTINHTQLGAVRVSLGWTSTESDVDDFTTWISKAIENP